MIEHAAQVRTHALTASGRCKACGRLQTRLTTDGNGGLVDVPTPCGCGPPPKRTPAWRANVDRERRLACICQLCDEPVAGKPKVALYCEAHRAEKRAETADRYAAKNGTKDQKAYCERNREKLRKKSRARYQKNAAERKRRNEYRRQWRKLNREKVRLQKERAVLKNFRNPQPGVKRWRQEVEAGDRQPKRARRNKGGERLCCRGLCRQVVHGHARMCDRCKKVEADLARQVLPTLRLRAA